MLGSAPDSPLKARPAGGVVDLINSRHNNDALAQTKGPRIHMDEGGEPMTSPISACDTCSGAICVTV